jgi:hypothetical protein
MGDTETETKTEYSKSELNKLAREYFIERKGPLADLFRLPAEAKSYLIATDAFNHHIRAMQFDAACGLASLTKSQQRGVEWFRKDAEKAAKKSSVRSRVGVNFDVQPQEDQG